jgi:hypothetical protein
VAAAPPAIALNAMCPPWQPTAVRAPPQLLGPGVHHNANMVIKAQASPCCVPILTPDFRKFREFRKLRKVRKFRTFRNYTFSHIYKLKTVFG